MTPEPTRGTETIPMAPEATRPSLAIDIAGADMLLRGRFRDWESVLTLGPDLDRIGVRLAVDATSAGGPDEDGCLFSFRSRSVEPTGPGPFRAQGIFTSARGPRPLDLTVETPPGHTALFALSFAADKDDFGDGWKDLIRKVEPFPREKEGEAVRLAHAWLTPPVLAAA